jgi:hypothetical protein
MTTDDLRTLIGDDPVFEAVLHELSNDELEDLASRAGSILQERHLDREQQSHHQGLCVGGFCTFCESERVQERWDAQEAATARDDAPCVSRL